MSIASEIGLTCMREVRRNLRSAKGLIASLLFLMGGGLSVLFYVWASKQMVDGTGHPLPQEAQMELRRRGLSLLYENDTAVVDYLVNAPVGLFFLYKSMLYFLPPLIILIGYDQLAGEIEYRTIRYTAMRARRGSLVVGKTLGMWIVAAVISLGLNAIAWGLTIGRGEADVSTTLSYGIRFWLMSAILAASYVGLTTLVSSFFKRPTLALLTAVAVSFVLGIARAAASFLPESYAWVRKVFPATWEPRLLSPHFSDVSIGSLVCIGFGAVCVAGAWFTLSRRDI